MWVKKVALIKMKNLNNITFSEDEELQCSIFKCIPGAGPVDANEVHFPNEEGLDLLKDFHWGLKNLLYRCVLNVPVQVGKSAFSPAAALQPSLHSSVLMPSAVVVFSPVTPPISPHRQVRTSNTQLIHWLDLSPSIRLFFFSTLFSSLSVLK